MSPVDLDPDLIEVLGKLDDLSILTAALAIVLVYVGPEHVKMAEEKMEKWFKHGQPLRFLGQRPIRPRPANPRDLKEWRGIKPGDLI